MGDEASIKPPGTCRLEVGTESSIDRSKSVKSFLMTLFKQSGNSDVQVCSITNEVQSLQLKCAFHVELLNSHQHQQSLRICCYRCLDP